MGHSVEVNDVHDRADNKIRDPKYQSSQCETAAAKHAAARCDALARDEPHDRSRGTEDHAQAKANEPDDAAYERGDREAIVARTRISHRTWCVSRRRGRNESAARQWRWRRRRWWWWWRWCEPTTGRRRRRIAATGRGRRRQVRHLSPPIRRCAR